MIMKDEVGASKTEEQSVTVHDRGGFEHARECEDRNIYP